MEQEEIWDAEAAAGYDTPGSGMFAPDVLGPAVERLAALTAGGAALEFAIGTGRVGIALSELGVPVTGVELSRHMIARLREKSDLPVVRGDMATVVAGADFALVYLVFNTISNLLTQQEQVACFRNAARHLRPGGRFVIELFVPRLGSPGYIFATRPHYLGVDTVDPVTQRLTSHHIEWETPPGRAARAWHTPQRYIWPAELDLMAQLAGLTLESRDADWAGSPFTAESTSHVSVYRRQDSIAA